MCIYVMPRLVLAPLRNGGHVTFFFWEQICSVEDIGHIFLARCHRLQIRPGFEVVSDCRLSRLSSDDEQTLAEI